jgi:hypothetical protein
VGEVASVENAEIVEATVVTEAAERAETLIVDLLAETRVLHLRKFTPVTVEDAL